MNIIITGHKGLIGHYLKKELENEGHNISLSIDKQEGRDVNIFKDFTLAPGVKIDMIVHLAAFCKINKTIENPVLGHMNGVETFYIMEFARKNNIKKIIYFSSSRVLSKEKNPYTAGKRYGEELVKAYKDCYDIDYIIIRPSTVYGPVLDKTKRLMHIFISNALLDKDLVIFGDPATKTLDFTYVTDFVDGVILAINSGSWNKAYNISGKCSYSIYQLARKIIEITGSKSKILVKDKEIAQPQEVFIDTNEIEKLGYSPAIDIETGMMLNIKFYQELFKKDNKIFDF